MSELISNLKEALEEMAKTGNQQGIDVLERAIRQASKLINTREPSA